MIVETILTILQALPAQPSNPNAYARVVDRVLSEEKELPLSQTDTAILLTAIAYQESTFRDDVRTCKVVGAKGEIGIFQAMPGPDWGGHTRDEICSSFKLQVELAVRKLVYISKNYTNTPLGMMRVYNGSSAHKESPYSKKMWVTWSKLNNALE